MTTPVRAVDVLSISLQKQGSTKVLMRYSIADARTLGLSGSENSLVFSIVEKKGTTSVAQRSEKFNVPATSSGFQSQDSFEYSLQKTGSTDVTLTAKLYKKGVAAPVATTVKNITLATGKVVEISSTSNPGGGASTPTPSPSPSAGNCADGQTGFANGLFCNTLFGNNVSAGGYFLNFYRWAVTIAIIGAAVAIVFAGYKYAMSRGNPSEISTAKEIIVSAIVGLVLLLLSFTIVRFLGINVV